MSTWIVFRDAAIGAAAVSFAAAVIVIAKWLIGLKGTLKNISETLSKVGSDVCDLYRIQGPQLAAQKALCEAAKGQINGNVDTALAYLEDANHTYNDTLLSRMNHTCVDRGEA